MNENRRRVNLWHRPDDLPGPDLDRVPNSMEDQLRLQDRLVAAERERRLAVEKTREQQELLGRNAEKTLRDLRTAAVDPAWSAALARDAGEVSKAGEAFVEMQTKGREFMSTTGSGLKSLFRSLFRGELNSARDLWGAFCNFLADAFSSALSRMASNWISSRLSDLLGAGTGLLGSSAGGGKGSVDMDQLVNAYGYHRGGSVGDAGSFRLVPQIAFAGAERLHAGLAPDEFPAILQKGEMVIPRDKWAYAAPPPTGGGGGGGGGDTRRQPLNVEVKIDNQSGTPLKLEKGPVTQSLDKIVVAIVARNIDENGVLRQMIQRR